MRTVNNHAIADHSARRLVLDELKQLRLERLGAFPRGGADAKQLQRLHYLEKKGLEHHRVHRRHRRGHAAPRPQQGLPAVAARRVQC